MTEFSEKETVSSLGMDEDFLTHNSQAGKGLAVLTSGGDSQGMNAAIRSVVRAGYFIGCDVYFIKEGYHGLITGGKNIINADWGLVQDIIHKAGTIIGTARSPEFREFSGRVKAAKNLIERKISNLVIIGGDGSLTGAELLKNEWPKILNVLFSTDQITEEQKNQFKHLNIVGIVGSIDNDFCGTDMTIGVDSALHRITEAIDAITSTAFSHRRTFIMEVMGRNCGYLALVAAVTSEADFVFIPEYPVPENWPLVLCNKLLQGRYYGLRMNIIIVCEGAVDKNGKKVTAQEIKDVISDTLQHDVRITVLGHVQRGGNPSAIDRILGSCEGVFAVKRLFEPSEDYKSYVVCLCGIHLNNLSLTDCVQKCKNVTTAIKNKEFDHACELKGPLFKEALNTYKEIVHLNPNNDTSQNKNTLGIIHVGQPVAGMNATVRTFVRHCLNKKLTVCAIQDGFEGLLKNNVKIMKWNDVNGWKCEGGAFLGTSSYIPTNFDEIAKKLGHYNIQGILFVGGFESYEAVIRLTEKRSHHKEFCVPMIVLPCSLSNNIPGTEFSLGSDTALNEIISICNNIQSSVQASNVDIFETTGNFCGYLATMTSVGIGADVSYINEEPFNISDLQNDMKHITEKVTRENIKGVIVTNEKANENYNTEFIYRLYKEEGKKFFSVEKGQIGAMQEMLSGPPSPFDRKLSTIMTVKAVDWFVDMLKKFTLTDGTVYANSNKCSVVLGLIRQEYRFTPVVRLKKLTDFEKQTSKVKWWLQMRPLIKILAHYKPSFDRNIHAPRLASYETSDARSFLMHSRDAFYIP